MLNSLVKVCLAIVGASSICFLWKLANDPSRLSSDMRTISKTVEHMAAKLSEMENQVKMIRVDLDRGMRFQNAQSERQVSRTQWLRSNSSVPYSQKPSGVLKAINNSIFSYPSAFDGDTTDEISCKMVTERDFAAPWYIEAQGQIAHTLYGTPRHRKDWEVAYITHIVRTHKLCEPGKRGLVFAVGKEHLPQLFASMGCDVVATDLPNSAGDAGIWTAGGMHSDALEGLYFKGYKGVSWETFKRRVQFRAENMNSLSSWLREQTFDFIWSLCSIEHTGSIALGQDAVLTSSGLLKPGGIAMHTVEFTISSETFTLQSPMESVWRKSDVEDLLAKARRKNITPFPVQWSAGTMPLDRNPDECDCVNKNSYCYRRYDHIRLACPHEGRRNFVKTSFAIVLQKPSLVVPLV